MCGFAVMVDLNGGQATAQVMDKMTAVIAHRGPDAEGVYLSGPVGLGFRRLSILDLSPSGHQPMVSFDGRKVLVFNGEIYNYLELRKELEGLGHTFVSSGDTEVLLHAYIEWGRQCLEKLNGMWAFIIYDMEQGTLFGSRDRFGIKPLYRYRSGHCLLFASEIKAILASGYYRCEINWQTASRFLLEGRLDEGTETFYAGIEQVSPGTAFEIDLSHGSHGSDEWRFWSLGNLEETSIQHPAHEFLDLFEDAIRLRMRSDVPVGVCLSGGLDSTAIISIMARLRGEVAGQPLQAFSYISEEFDESRYIADTIIQTKAELNRLETVPSALWDHLHRVLWYHDEPMHSATALIGFELMRLAAQTGIKVVLNGQGADETLAGYHSYFKNYWYTLLRAGRVRDVWQEIHAYCREHGGKAPKLFQETVSRLFRTELGRLPAYRRMAYVKQQRLLRNDAWFSPDLATACQFDQKSWKGEGLDTALRESVERRPLPIYLRIEDRNSMAHSIESRLPFLDYRVVSLAWQMAPNWKMRGPWNKYILRESMRGHIPESVRTRLDKMGFPTSVRSWFANQWYEPMQDLLASQESSQRGIYHVDTVRRMLDRHKRGEVDASRRLFRVAQFEILAEHLKSGFAGCLVS